MVGMGARPGKAGLNYPYLLNPFFRDAQRLRKYGKPFQAIGDLYDVLFLVNDKFGEKVPSARCELLLKTDVAFLGTQTASGLNSKNRICHPRQRVLMAHAIVSVLLLFGQSCGCT